MKLSYLFNLIACCGFSLSCSAAKLPETRASDFKLEYHIGGGMRNISEDLILSETESYYRYHYEGAEIKLPLNITSQELDEVYQILRKNNFPRITTTDGLIHDKGGAAVRIRWKGYHHYLGTSGTEIASRWKEEWKKINQGIQALRDRKLEPLKKEMITEFDISVWDKRLIVTYNDIMVWNLVMNQKNAAQTHKVLPGKHTVRIQYWKEYDPQKKYYLSNETKNIVVYHHEKIDFSQISKIKISFDGERIRLKTQ